MRKSNHRIFYHIPDQTPMEQAIKRTTHMAIGAHPDDLEIMAYEGILKCFQSKDLFFFGVVATQGSGSSRSGIYAKTTDKEMIDIRKNEQIKAANIGQYSALALLNYSSDEIKNPTNDSVIRDLVALIRNAKPTILYTHNLADQHDTHVALTIKVIQAIRRLPVHERPNRLLGCEVWRDLDWMMDDDKVVMDVSGNPQLEAALINVFDSQIAGGKQYLHATMGRRVAHATYFNPHAVDRMDSAIYAMELTPLIHDDSLSIESFVSSMIERFQHDVIQKIRQLT